MRTGLTRAGDFVNLAERLEGAPACFYFRVCGRPAELEKQGRTVCRPCAGKLPGVEYELRPAGYPPLYPTDAHLTAQLEMKGPPREARR